ncbi:hypothetical protein SAMN05444161_3314 [Rhizobiales bacterium GAS191]|jgi:HPt (histidine-containing phosphotransfer) domain-containing protein|nr:hypothetical protein SAMN05519103_02440 [Rhizobiales bacterium GAS113]SED48985.1 hypothetical protein SAMN05444161_3314 [Rhizobiales bacterium GAS191]
MFCGTWSADKEIVMKSPTKIDGSRRPGGPISGQDSAAGPRKMLDILHLERQVLGDMQLRDELLRLYAEQLMALGPLICGAPGQARSEAAHTLRGASLAIGALALAHVCGELEAQGNEAGEAGQGGEETRREAALVIEGTRRRVAELLRS